MELRNLTPDNFAAIEALSHVYEDALQDILCAGEAEGVIVKSGVWGFSVMRRSGLFWWFQSRL